MKFIGQPLTPVKTKPEELFFRYRGKIQTLPAVLFFLLLYVILYWTGLPRFFPYMQMGVAVFLLLGGIGTFLLYATDILINIPSCIYEIRRGFRGAQARVAGSLSDFAGLIVWFSECTGERMWHVCLLPKGTVRAYSLVHFESRKDADGFCVEYSNKLGIPLLSAPPMLDEELETKERILWDKYTKSADIRKPPQGSRISVSNTRDTCQVRLPKNGLFSQTVTVDKNGLKVGLLFREDPVYTKIRWNQITQIQIEALERRGDPDCSIRVHWRLEKNWRVNMHKFWAMRCNELKRPVAPISFFGVLWYFLDIFPLTTIQTIAIRTMKGLTAEIGEDRHLTQEEFVWLFHAINRAARAAGVSGVE